MGLRMQCFPGASSMPGPQASVGQLAVLLAIEHSVPSTEMCALLRWCAVDKSWRASVSVTLQRVGVAMVHIQHCCAELGVAEWDSDWGEQVQIFDIWRSWWSPLLQRKQRSSLHGASSSSSAMRFARLRSDRQLRAANDVAGWVASFLSPQVGEPERPVIVVVAAEERLAALAVHALRSQGAPVCMVSNISLANVLSALGRVCNPPTIPEVADGRNDSDSGFESYDSFSSSSICLCCVAGRFARKTK
eukprot:TRINITY_DN57223_c0_g1_i1.p1 TRINITY_DN57223_c0_g1~~TRINITY_DN57223_c0_g1_i1.p1  ORF type:complete len:247 (-),score=28.39 TRINITY_DN57223_c0_g1_i1:129-869(-)